MFVYANAFFIRSNLILKLADTLTRSRQVVRLAIKAFITMTTHAATLVEKVTAEIQGVGALRNAILRVTLLAAGFRVFLLKHRPQPELMPPVTLLVTTGTSGAAELFAAALDGNKRAEMIGERTLGRAGIQKLVRLPEGRGLWLTYARYLTPDLGVDEPDVDFDQPRPAKDPILDAALERIAKKKAA